MGSGEHSLRFTHESEPPPAPGSSDDPYVGQVFGGRYRILSKLAEGA